MCGIIGYIGHREVIPVLINGLRRMEYRGYDSAGIAVLHNGSAHIAKVSGKVNNLVERVNNGFVSGTIGLGHTRWATHGEPNERNAHPHTDCKQKIVLIHNGIIENYYTLKVMLAAKGHIFRTETDSEVLAHLIEEFYQGDIEQAVRTALQQVKGTYGLTVLCTEEPDRLIAARMGSPLIVGLGKEEYFVASDMAAMIDYTREVIFLNDGEMAILTPKGVIHTDLKAQPLQKEVSQIFFDIEEIEKGGFPHFMLKEIFEQPQSITNTLRGRLLEEDGTAKLGGLTEFEDQLREVKRFIIVACGTSWHAGLIGEYLIEELAGIPVEVEYASEFRYRNPIIEPGTIVIAISQSGETADTLEAMREAKKRGALALGIVNVVGSTIARESHGGIYLHAGPEIGVASTKAFTSQVAVLTMLALKLGRQRRVSLERGRQLVRELLQIPDKVSKVLQHAEVIKEIAAQFVHHNHALYLSRGINYPVALEGALKLKEISYLHAEGYPAAEMKHGPIALIDANMPVIFIAVNGAIYDKVIQNIEEVRSRKGIIIAVVNEGDELIKKYAHYLIEVPPSDHLLSPILTVIPLQLFAYYLAVMRGCDVDQPRNLAKSVTVE